MHFDLSLLEFTCFKIVKNITTHAYELCNLWLILSHLNVDLSSALVRLANVWMYVRYSGLSAQRICCSSQIVAVFSMMDNGLGRIMVGMI